LHNELEPAPTYAEGTCVCCGRRTTFIAEWLRADEGLCWWECVRGADLVRPGDRLVGGAAGKLRVVCVLRRRPVMV